MADSRKRLHFPISISDLLAGSFRGKPLEKRLGEVEIWRVWDRVAGKQIASKARPSKLYGGVLTVVVSSAPWMQQLNFLKRDLVERLNAATGGDLIKDIYLKAGRISHSQPGPSDGNAGKRRLTAAEKEEITAATESVKDPGLRQAFAGLMALHLASAPRGKTGGK
jgi:hypothetical protein